MAGFSIAEDIIPMAQFKSHASEWMRKLGEGTDAVVITNNGRAAGVLVSPSEYDRLTYTERLLSSVREGFSDVEAGRVYTTSNLLNELVR